MWVVLLVYGVFAFVPSVYAPVLGGHAAICLLSARHARSDCAAHLLIAGGVGLVAIAGAGLGMEFAGLQDAMYGQAFWYLPGLCGPAYLLILAGWRAEAAALGPARDIRPRNKYDLPTHEP